MADSATACEKTSTEFISLRWGIKMGPQWEWNLSSGPEEICLEITGDSVKDLLQIWCISRVYWGKGFSKCERERERERAQPSDASLGSQANANTHHTPEGHHHGDKRSEVKDDGDSGGGEEQLSLQ